MKTIVISGINIVNGGAKSIYDELLDAIIKTKSYKESNFIILVSKKSLFKRYKPFFKIIEFPKSKKSWINRLFYEYIYFKRFSKKIKPDIWLSMHDMTPNVVATKRYVYCHNTSPFYNMPFREAKYGWKYYLFSKFYKYLYEINIHKNDAVIVQQEWMAKEFKKMYHLNNIIIARPTVLIDKIPNNLSHNNKFRFIYPSFPRPFKNFETLCKATKILNKKGLKNKFDVYITLNGTENNYSKMLFNKYGKISNLKFIGLQSKSNLYNLYSKSDCLVFISKLESWGLPITEFKQTDRPILTSDLPYAYETVGDYNKVIFVKPDDSTSLSKSMELIINRKKIYSNNYSIPNEFKVINGWDNLVRELFD